MSYICIMKSDKTILRIDNGQEVEALAPLIVSASRATDIPAFYADWMFERLDKGYVRWRNPYNGRDSYVSFAKTKFIVFWSKNPRPLLPFLDSLKQRGIGCYIQYTLNDYEAEGLEPNVPPLCERIDTFHQIISKLGPGSVVWRFDPLILTEKISIDSLLAKISNIAGKLNGASERLVFSFADIATYRKVGPNLKKAGINYREWSEGEMLEFASRLASLNLGLRLSTCAERIPLEEFGIEHNRCIDPELINRLKPELQPYLWNAKHDKGQRPLCGCISSKDIGTYNTCPHGCLYCYANSTPQAAIKNHHLHITSNNSDCLIL